MSGTTDLNVVQIDTIKTLVDQLHDLHLSPLHLHIDALHVGDTRPNARLWLRYRTDMERYCAANKLKAVEARYSPAGQRTWHTQRDTDSLRLLVSCVSLEHHPDWQPKPRPEVAV